MARHSLALGLIVAGLASSSAHATHPVLDEVLSQSVSTLDYGMLRLERSLEARLSMMTPTMVTRGNFGPREYAVSVRLDEDGRTILIQPVIRAYEYFDDSKCQALIDDVRQLVISTDSPGGDDGTLAAFFGSSGLSHTRRQALERQLMDRITIRAALVTHAVGDEEPALTYCEAPLRPGRPVNGR